MWGAIAPRWPCWRLLPQPFLTDVHGAGACLQTNGVAEGGLRGWATVAQVWVMPVTSASSGTQCDEPAACSAL
jgi:hypothetical protein